MKPMGYTTISNISQVFFHSNSSVINYIFRKTLVRMVVSSFQRGWYNIKHTRTLRTCIYPIPWEVFQEPVQYMPINNTQLHLDVSENSGLSPQIIHFNEFSHRKPSILGYPYFWKHPFHGSCLPFCVCLCFWMLLVDPHGSMWNSSFSLSLTIWAPPPVVSRVITPLKVVITPVNHCF